MINSYPPTPWSPKAKGKARGEAVHGRDTKVRREVLIFMLALCGMVADLCVGTLWHGSCLRAWSWAW